MGHSQDSKLETHEKILHSAGKRFREAGLQGIGVADLMQEVGLTVGGFYKHFSSRAALVAEALATMRTGWDAIFEHARERQQPNSLLFDALVDGYLSTEHRDHPGEGCLFAALSGELGRADEEARTVATRKLATVLEKLTNVFDDRRAPAARAAALFAYSALVGALTLARATNDEALSREILATTAKALKKGLRPARATQPKQRAKAPS
ncbi:MAG TPA: TetR/AcrR family transcriptional regulator [Polyangiaceae bacterium]|nr:TetR/AcrR family transcriptional regulator [Polyangiaceae bacterium]